MPDFDIGADLSREFAISGPALFQQVSPFPRLALFTQAGDVIVDEDGHVLLAEESEGT